MRIVCRAGSTSGNWDGWALIELSEEQIKGILERRELLQMVASKASDARELLFWNWDVEFREGQARLSEVLSEDEIEALGSDLSTGFVLGAAMALRTQSDDDDEEEGKAGQDEDIESENDEDVLAQTAIDHLHVHESGIHFTGTCKHSDEEFVTRTLRYDDLLAGLRLENTTRIETR